MGGDEANDDDFLKLARLALGNAAGDEAMYQRLLRRGMQQTRERQ